MESEVKTEQQETKIIRKNERYPHQHQQQKLVLLNEHSFLHDSAKLSPSDVSTTSNNFIIANSQIANNKIGQHEYENDAEDKRKSNMDEINTSTIIYEDNLKDSQKMSIEHNIEEIFEPLNLLKMINGHCEDRSIKENKDCNAPIMSQELNQCGTGFRIGHFAECLAEDVLEDSLLEAKAEIDNKEDKVSIIDQTSKNMEPIKNNNVICNDDQQIPQQDINTNIPPSSTSTQGLPNNFSSSLKNSVHKSSDSRVHSKSLCLNDSNAYTEICSKLTASSQLQPNSSCPQMDEKLKELTDFQQLVQNFPSEDIIPFDQEDECCSNSVVEGLDRLLSDDDIEEDIENQSNTIMDNLGCADKLTKAPQEESTSDMEATPAHEYNLFNPFDPQQTQTLPSNIDSSNSIINHFPNMNRFPLQKDPVSNHWEITENICDKPNNVINSPEMLESQAPNPHQYEYDNIININHNTDTHMENSEEQVLSNISSLLQYLPEQVEKLVTDCSDVPEVVFFINNVMNFFKVPCQNIRPHTIPIHTYFAPIY